MAGIYIHIPFCKKACHYCDFHFSTSLQYKAEMLTALRKEIELKSLYLDKEPVETIYFGGGTPSILDADDIGKLIGSIAESNIIAPNAEITLEANPDDLSKEKVKALRNTSVNRFSIGIQSFFEDDLRWMNRAHNATEAETAILRVQDAGFENLTADLIYGYPLLTDEKWKSNIQKMLDFGIPHISSYSMTVEEKTALAVFISSGKQKNMDDSQSAAQYSILMNMLQAAGFEHYEISNFAQPGHYSRHNTNYWRGVSYIGIGPSAHSFNGKTRQWNIANNNKYIESLFKNIIPAEIEKLSTENKINEYIMTSIRTIWGTDLNKISQLYGENHSRNIANEAEEYISRKWLSNQSGTLFLTTEGKFFADRIAADLFVEKLVEN